MQPAGLEFDMLAIHPCQGFFIQTTEPTLASSSRKRLAKELKDIGWLIEFWGKIENQLNATKLGVTARKEPNYTSCLSQET